MWRSSGRTRHSRSQWITSMKFQCLHLMAIIWERSISFSLEQGRIPQHLRCMVDLEAACRVCHSLWTWGLWVDVGLDEKKQSWKEKSESEASHGKTGMRGRAGSSHFLFPSCLALPVGKLMPNPHQTTIFFYLCSREPTVCSFPHYNTVFHRKAQKRICRSSLKDI